MATLKFSTLKTGQTYTFNPVTDKLEFDDKSIAAGSGSISQQGSTPTAYLSFSYGGKSFNLKNGTKDLSLAGLNWKNVTFADGSMLRVGDDTTDIVKDDEDNSLVGGTKNDLILGLGGNDTLDGGKGADFMDGGGGADIYVVDNQEGDKVIEGYYDAKLSTEWDLVLSSVTFNLTDNGTNVEHLTLTGTDDIDGTGNTLNNNISGNAGDNVLIGGTGLDTLYGGAGQDTLDGGSSGDTMNGGDGDDIYYVDSNLDVIQGESPSSAGGHDLVKSTFSHSLSSSVEDLELLGTGTLAGTGNALDNQITGNSGDNRLDGLDGADTLKGGDANDTYVVEDAGDLVIEDKVSTLTTEIDLVESFISYTLTANVEWLQLMGTASINATGNEMNNILFANANDNVFDGKGGIDTVSYSLTSVQMPKDMAEVNETGVPANAGVVVSLATTQPQTTFGSGNDTFSYIENLIGSKYNDSLTGNLGINILDGGLGADILTGGDGEDTYYVDCGNDLAVETNADQTQADTVKASASYRLSDNLENLTLIGTEDINGTGNGLVNDIQGNDGDNLLDGAGGADNLEGGKGDDRYLADGLDSIGEDSGAGTDLVMTTTGIMGNRLPNYVENLLLLGTSELNGTGNTLDNVIYANVKNNVLDGGANTTKGDTLSYEYGATSGVKVGLSEISQQKTVGSGNDTISNFENLTGSGYDDTLTGTNPKSANDSKDHSGDNVLNGLNGRDTVSYGQALAAVSIDLNNDKPQFTGGAGYDTLLSIENLIGSAFDDTFLAGLKNNILNGGIGTDTVSYDNTVIKDFVVVDLAITKSQNTGGSGRDTLSNIENLIGTSFGDTLSGNTQANRIDGGLGADRLDGRDGNDILDGGAGQDILTGGKGKDLFTFRLLADTNLNSPDQIKDFSKTQGDKIDLSQDNFYFDETFTFIGTKSFSGTDGELRYQFSGSNTLVSGDVDGDGAADFAIQLTGKLTLTATDFML